MINKITVEVHTGGVLLRWMDQRGTPPVGGFQPETEIVSDKEDAKARLSELVDEVFEE